MLSVILISISIEVFKQPFQLTVALQPAFMSLYTAVMSEAAIRPWCLGRFCHLHPLQRLKILRKRQILPSIFISVFCGLFLITSLWKSDHFFFLATPKRRCQPQKQTHHSFLSLFKSPGKLNQFLNYNSRAIESLILLWSLLTSTYIFFQPVTWKYGHEHPPNILLPWNRMHQPFKTSLLLKISKWRLVARIQANMNLSKLYSIKFGGMRVIDLTEMRHIPV